MPAYYQPCANAKNLLTEYLEDMADAAAADAALLELANDEDGVISMAEWEQQQVATMKRSGIVDDPARRMR